MLPIMPNLKAPKFMIRALRDPTERKHYPDVDVAAAGVLARNMDIIARPAHDTRTEEQENG